MTSTTVPFLAAILRDGPDQPETKEFLITYLHHLALGYPDDLFPEVFNPDEEFSAVAGVQDPGGEPDYSLNDDRPLIWMRDSYEAVESCIESIIPFLGSPHDKVAEAAIAFCGSFPRCREKSVPPLRGLASNVDRRGALAAVSLAVLEAPGTDQLSKQFAASPDQLTAVIGSCAIVLFDAASVSPDIVETLTAPLQSLGEIESAHASTVSTLVGRCLEKLGPDFRERAVQSICRQLKTARPMEAMSLTQSLLTLVFNGQPPKNASELSMNQRMAVETIRDFGPFKVSGGIFANYASMLAGWGLPQSAAAIDKWLKKRRFGIF